MSQPIAVNILSDDEDEKDKNTPACGNDSVCINLATPLPTKKKPRLSDPEISNPSSGASVFIIDDDDPTPRKHSAGSTFTPSIVAETPSPLPFSSHFLKFQEASIVKCSKAASGVNSTPSTPSVVGETPASEFSSRKVPILRCGGLPNLQPGSCLTSELKSNEKSLICVESDNESENHIELGTWKPHETTSFTLDMSEEIEWSCKLVESTSSFGEASEVDLPTISSCRPNPLEDDISKVHGPINDKNDQLEGMDKVPEEKSKRQKTANSKRSAIDAKANGRMSKEDRLRLKEEKKQQKEQEKLHKAAQKAEAAEMKKLQKEKQKWDKGKFALKSIVAEIDTKVAEVGSIGGHLLTRFAEKGLSFRITSNPIERSIVWTLTVPEEFSQISSEGIEISYVLLVYEAEEFCNLVMSGTLMDQVSRIRHHYPYRTISLLTNRLMAYINKRERGQYKNPTSYTDWKRPPIEEVLALLTTNFNRVHSRQCVDEAELAEHVIGLTCSLASCQFRKKLTQLSVNANGSLIPKDCTDRNLIKRNIWLKSLIAIPKVQPRFAIAIWKKYPTMKSLLSVYMDPRKSVHEKEFLLKDLTTEGLLGDDIRLGEICSKRVYRILMAQRGSIKTDDVENGADFFSHQNC